MPSLYTKELLQKKLSNDDLYKTCLTLDKPLTDRTDCVPNTLYLLNILDEMTAGEYAKIANEEKKGLRYDVIIDLLFQHMKRINRTVSYTIPENKRVEFLDTLLKDTLSLGAGYGTVGIFYWENTPKKIGHAVAIVRSLAGDIGIIDLQSSGQYFTPSEIQEFLENGDWKTVAFLITTPKRLRSKRLRSRSKISPQQTKKLKTAVSTVSVETPRKTKKSVVVLPSAVASRKKSQIRTRTKTKKSVYPERAKMDIDEESYIPTKRSAKNSQQDTAMDIE